MVRAALPEGGVRISTAPPRRQAAGAEEVAGGAREEACRDPRAGRRWCL